MPQGEQPEKTEAGATAAPGLSDPERWVDLYGDYLFNYALGRLRDAGRAEDVVQETFLAALRSRSAFAGRSAERSWLVGILKNKIFDLFRKASRETVFTDLQFYAAEETDGFTADGPGRGGWNHELGPENWHNAGEALDHEQFWTVYRECCQKLPGNIATVFNLREVDDVGSKDICAMLNISESNLWVMLHRARMALRKCLESNWFSKQK